MSQQYAAGNTIPMAATASESPLAPIDANTRQRLSKIDGPFRPIDGPFDSNQEAWSLRLPESIYSTVFMLPLAVDKTMWADTSNFFTIFVSQILSYLLLVSTQAILAYYMYVETFFGDTSTSSTDTSTTTWEYTSVCRTTNNNDNTSFWILRCVCLWVTILFLIRDFRDTLSIYRWIQCVPEWHPGHQEITDYCCRYSGRTSMPMQRFHDDYGVTVQKPAVGFTRGYRTAVLLFVVVPKVLWSLFLLVYGTGYVMAVTVATFDAIVLRVLVLILVLSLDKLLYQVLIPDVFQTWVCTNFVITFSEEEENEAVRWLPLFLIVLMGGLVTGSYFGWCQYAHYFYIPLPLLGI